jgi:hypothetical protein
VTERTVKEVTADILGMLAPELHDAARTQIEASRILSQYSALAGSEKKNKRLAGQIEGCINKLEKLLATLPEGFPVHYLFVSESSTRAVTTAAAAEAINSEAEAGYDTLARCLGTMRTACQAIQAEGRRRDVTNYEERRASTAAKDLCLLAGKPLHWATPTSDYRRLASLLFEMATGKHDVELENACEFVARQAKT